MDFFLRTVAHPDGRIARRGRLSGRRLERATEYFRLHLSEKIRLDHVAAAAGLSVHHFARMFKKTTGLTPHRYLMEARVERAKELLRECERTLTEIAVDCGFCDQSHMTKVFKHFAGVSPMEFRARWGEPQKQALTTPPSTLSAAPLVAEESGLQT